MLLAFSVEEILQCRPKKSLLVKQDGGSRPIPHTHLDTSLQETTTVQKQPQFKVVWDE